MSKDIAVNIKAIQNWIETGTATIEEYDYNLADTLEKFVTALATTTLVSPNAFLVGLTAGTIAASQAATVDVNKRVNEWNVSGVVTLTNSSNAGAINFAGCTPGTNTTGSLISTGASWVVHTTAGSCAVKLLCSSNVATGDYATLRIRARADHLCANTYNVASVEGINSSASANHADYPNLFGVQGLAQPNALTQANTTNVTCGVYSCIDKTATHAGSVYSMWIDDHSTTAKATNHFLLRMTQNALGGTPVSIDGAISISPSRLPQLFTFDAVSDFLSVSGIGETFTKSHKIAVKIAGDATQYYIEVGTI